MLSTFLYFSPLCTESSARLQQLADLLQLRAFVAGFAGGKAAAGLGSREAKQQASAVAAMHS